MVPLKTWFRVTIVVYLRRTTSFGILFNRNITHTWTIYPFLYSTQIKKLYAVHENSKLNGLLGGGGEMCNFNNEVGKNDLLVGFGHCPFIPVSEHCRYLL